MPFTLAHPAAVLPLRGLRHLRTAPLIIGAIAPDMPYYVPVSFERFMPDTHDFEGSYTTCLVLGYWRMLGLTGAAPPADGAALTAGALAVPARDRAAAQQRPSAWLLAGCGARDRHVESPAVGCRHAPDGWIVRRVAALSAPVTIGSYTGPVCHVLQYVSSVFGLLVMAIWYWRLHSSGGGAARPARATFGRASYTACWWRAPGC